MVFALIAYVIFSYIVIFWHYRTKYKSPYKPPQTPSEYAVIGGWWVISPITVFLSLFLGLGFVFYFFYDEFAVKLGKFVVGKQ